MLFSRKGVSFTSSVQPHHDQNVVIWKAVSSFLQNFMVHKPRISGSHCDNLGVAVRWGSELGPYLLPRLFLVIDRFHLFSRGFFIQSTAVMYDILLFSLV